MEGFGPQSSDYDVQVVNTKTGAGVRVTADRPLASLMLWSIRAVMSVEPFVEFSVKPGDTELVFACANLEESQLFRARGCATVSKPFRLAELGALLVGSADRKISRSIG